MRLIVVFLLFFLASSFLKVDSGVNVFEQSPEEIKLKAFKILQTKCNDCHKLEGRKEIFTFENMDAYATKINKQVFIKRKMPKGDLYNLTETEELRLKDWLANIQKSKRK